MSTVLPVLAAYLGVHVVIVALLVVVNVTERGVRPRPGLRSVSCFARETASWAAIPFMLAAGAFEGRPGRSPAPGSRRPEPEEAKPGQAQPGETDAVEAGAQLGAEGQHDVPVLLVPGYAFNRGTLLMLSWYLRRRGWSWVWAVNNRPWSCPAEEFVERLSARVDRILEASGASQVDLVGHSMGGAIAAVYAANEQTAPKVRRIVTLGTPWSGTKLHVWGNRRQARDLAPDAPLLARAREARVPIVGIWSESDGIVAPPSSSRPPEHGRAQHIPYVGHVEMVLSARVYRAVAAALRASDPLATPVNTPLAAST